MDVPGAAGGLTWHFEEGPDIPSRPGARIAWLDVERLHFPLILRPWRHGDRMRPLGLGGSKLVSDLLIDARVPLPLKERVYVLVSGEEIVWLAGLRVAEGVVAGKDTKRVLRIAVAG
ncbi:MAG: tRNA lysidine(34) synthetase TilS [Flavobacteriales bacterium]